MLYVENTTLAVYSCGYQVRDENNTTRVEVVRFLPGMNQIEDEDWKKVKDNVGLIQRLDEGMLRIAREVESAPKKEEETLSNKSMSQIVAIIHACRDLDQLKKWHAADKRQKVKAALKDQIEIVKLAGDE